MARKSCNDEESKEKLYCSNRNCPHIECVRHNRNTPFNVLIKRDRFNLDKSGLCDNILFDWNDM